MAKLRKRQVAFRKRKTKKTKKVVKKRQTKNKQPILKKYLIHDNGGRPFAVHTNSNKVNTLIIFNNSTKKQVAKYNNCSKVWIPNDISKNKQFVGNSILANLKNNRYLYIGSEIYEFKAANGDKIVKYVSNVGNSDVPYPYAIGSKYVYIMLDKVYCAKNEFTKENFDADEVYSIYYNQKRSIIAGKMNILKQVSKRL